MREVATTRPRVQPYTGKILDGSLRGCRGTYRRWGGLCLAAPHFPDSVHRPGFPSTIVGPGETY